MTIPREPLTTERLVLEPVGPEHAGRLWTAIERSLAELRPWLVWTGSASPEAERAFCEDAPAEWDAGRAYSFVVLADGEPAGACGANVPKPMLPHAEIGYWIRSDLAGRGLATEAARATRDFAFDTLEVVRLSLRAGIDNHASCRVAEKLGFAREGTMRAGGHGAEAPYDAYLFGMLPTDPRP